MVKAIILAAGMGTRLGNYTKDLPKGMLNFNGKSLIERQIEILKSCNIHNIIIVTGFKPEKINFTGVKYVHNKEYDTTNMVASLFSAEAEFTEEIIVCYSDIIYEKSVIKNVLEAKANIGVVVDENYLDYWKARSADWKNDVESLVINNNEIIDLGNTKCSLKEAKERYVGIIKFSTKGIQNLKKYFHKNKKLYWDKDEKWKRSKSFKKAYMTCMLQELIDNNIIVSPIIIQHGWMEFDTVEDYDKAIKWLKEGSINRFIDIKK